MMKTSATTALLLHGLRLSVYLGIYPEELLKKQIVTVDLRIHFLQPPKACFSDQITDTYCYDQLIRYLKEKLNSKKFQMLEYLTQEIYLLLKNYLPSHTSIIVSVTKQPPHLDLAQGVTFEYGD